MSLRGTPFHLLLPVFFASAAFAAEGPGSPATGMRNPIGVQAQQDITVITSNAQSMVFEYRPRYGAVTTFSAGGNTYTQIDFEQSASLYPGSAAGTPDLRCRTIPLAFPSQTGNSVQVIASDYEDVGGTLLAPIPDYRMKDGMLEPTGYRMDQGRYGQNVFLPGNVAELSAISRSRSMLLGNVRVAPVQFNPATRTMRKYSRIVVEVVYGAAAGTRVQNRQDDILFNNSTLNAQTAQGWKFGPAARISAATTNSVLATGPWYRIAVSEDGVYMLDAATLSGAGINLSGVDPRTIRVYGNGGKEVPEDLTQGRPADLVENAVYVQGEGDGTFDATDYVLFYGKSVRGWTYDAGARTLHHYIDHYTEVNYYWLTFGGVQGKRMQAEPSVTTSSPVYAATKFPEGVAIEEEEVNVAQSGKNWYGQNLNQNSSFTYVKVLPGLVGGSTITYRYSLVASASDYSTYSIETGFETGYLNISSLSGFEVAVSGTGQMQGTSTLPGNTTRLKFTFTAPVIAKGWIDWAEIVYPHDYTAVNDYLHFRSPDTTAVVQYPLQGFAGTPMIFNVTDPANVRQVTGATGFYTFQAAETGGSPSEYCAAARQSWKHPAGIESVRNQNLRGYSGGGQFIIVTAPDFRSAADRLAAYRSQPAHGGLKTVVVEADSIYNEFSGGLPDISGIRDYLKYAYENWNPQPVYVLLFGNGTYDYKGLLGSRSTFVPTWQSPESNDEVDSYCTDDFFAKLGPGDGLFLVLGRISARTALEANTVVNKLIDYETNSAHDTWKMRMLYVADDAWTPETGYSEGTQHAVAVEELSLPPYTPEEFENKKIYTAEYPVVQSALGRRIPGAYRDIIDNINAGVLMVSYAGHGNPQVWAHESIFEVGTSIPQLVNAHKLPVFFIATCTFSRFDDPKAYTGGEVLLDKPDGGAIGAVGATRPTYGGYNKGLSEGTYRQMFGRDGFGRVQLMRPAEALFRYKLSGGVNRENDQKYLYMGDPTMRLQFPQGYASIDSVNHQAVDSVNGAPRTTLIQLKALSLVNVSGTIRDAGNQVDGSFNGRASIVVNDATRTDVIANYAPGLSYSYVAPGATVYRGDVSVVNGRFSSTFVVPKDISYGDTVSHGRLVAYCWNDASDGAAYTGNIHVGGTDTTVANNFHGPAIDIYLENRSFRPGDIVSPNPLLQVDLADSSGINTSVAGIGHRIEAWVNNSTQSQDITDFYQSKLDNYREGTVQLQLKDLPSGKNTLRVRAWDAFDNSSTAETFFNVSSNEQLAIGDIMNYPNPFSGETEFTFRPNLLEPLTIQVKIYTVAGRLIQTLDGSSSGNLFVRIPWDGRDRDGDRLANGVYFYKLLVRTVDGRFSSEALGKLAVLR